MAELLHDRGLNGLDSTGEQTLPACDSERLQLRVAAELDQDRANVVARCRLGDSESPGDPLGREPLVDQGEHLRLTSRQWRWAPGGLGFGPIVHLPAVDQKVEVERPAVD
jgi:hypothetical protein